MKEKKLNSELKRELKNKVILVTGGSGSIGSSIVKELLNYPVKGVRVFDIDEYGLSKLKRKLKDNRLRFLLGSILDKDRIEMACNNVDIVIHTAAIKNIEISEFNPIETIDVNINGTVNLIKTCIKTKPKKVLNISTDKAVLSTTLYGSTKQMGEKLMSWAGMHLQPVKFGTVRLGNVMETRGNVFEIWNEQLQNNEKISITVPDMKRYFFKIEEAVDFILNCIPKINDGEIFVPKMKSYTIKSLADKISKKQKIIGLRQGEKLEELLITNAEKKIAKNLKNMWVISDYNTF
jgi:UDP-N-acetylglucosamine 4,6-dehydratase/5-epimerase